MSSINIQEVLCADPVGGAIYKHLFNGGSWFEADQMHWRLEQQWAITQLQTVVAAKPTKANQEKACSALGSLEECVKQLVPQNEAKALFLKADQVVKAWAPAPKPAKDKPKTINVFAALDEESEEE